MRSPKPIPPELLDLIVYDETSPSCLRWKEGGKGRRPDLRVGCQRKRGYWQVRYAQKAWMAHRLVWALHHGEPGGLVVDHIDNDPANNRIQNLQAITIKQNSSRKNGKGYSWSKRDRRWQVVTSVKGKATWIGSFATEEEARAAYVKAKKEVTEGLQVDLD